MKRSDIRNFIKRYYNNEKFVNEEMTPSQKQDRIAHADAASKCEEEYEAEDGSKQKVTFSKEEGEKILAEELQK